jgi:hypothetical protein
MQTVASRFTNVYARGNKFLEFDLCHATPAMSRNSSNNVTLTIKTFSEAEINITQVNTKQIYN